MRVLIAAGGTGGHIYPGIAVAKEIMRRNTESEVRFVGTVRGLENRLVPQAGFALEHIESAGLKNVGLAARVRGLAVMPKSFFAARRVIRNFAPDAVVGAGGYVTGSVLLTAALMRLPTLVMESNALPGFTNRTLARFIDKAAVSFDEALKFFPAGKAVVTGNPVRHEFFDIKPKERDAARFSILIFGGSQGARAINHALLDALSHLSDVKDKLFITHQTGEFDFTNVESGYARAGWTERADVRQYLDNIVEQFATADLVLCRAGATTTAELIAAGKAAIMIPFPQAADDHQRKNAEALERAGAAKMIIQADLTGEKLAQELLSLINAPENVTTMEQRARALARGNAAAATVDLIESLIRTRSR